MAHQQAMEGENLHGSVGYPAEQMDGWDETWNRSLLTYEPVYLGHPHEQAEEQVTEPFHWQYPNWARPGYQLYYYKGYGYFDHPLYTSQTPDGQTLLASYGNEQRFKQPPVAAPSEPTPARPKQEMVDVYFDDEFLEEMPLRLLTRFSVVASVTFWKTKKSGGRRADEQSDERESPTSKMVDSVMSGTIPVLENTTPTAPKKWRDTSPSATSDSTVFDTWSTSRSRSDTRTTELTIPEEFADESYVPDHPDVEATPHVGGGKSAARRRRRRRAAAKKGKKELHLGLNVRELPTKEVVLEAIAWMKSNEERHGDQTLPYGPEDLSKLGLEDIVELYQVALAFGLQPWPGRLKMELNERISSTCLDFKTFRDITRWLPFADSGVARAINQVYYHMRRGSYTAAEAEIFDMYMSRPGNERLQSRAHELHVVRQQPWEQENNPS
ncbi:hypothetical protein M409DRAFT_25051 [Zasmidium cellare ATCC 36951]|uniref:Uncharacterized protein n=1 Tax=Zasmidium cellare ATCC 36951 TaxID=1080233 RepID=A0A6A6CBU2_ZASCE|nr:uncharacterized protein M409DRAFT_25051 [Zasmidium cellare ATCC 36951]KAF2164657.1 hypothetical protein M409DRAFT_25051 [Zasmidium cellare ATCC 36951]